jgi:hypothetical protein
MAMTRAIPVACALVLALGTAAPAGAGDVRLFIKDGRVALVARDATLRDILVEWERVGGTHIVNRDRVPGTRLNLEIPNVSEEEALATLLRPIAGYMASRRLGPDGGPSVFSRIVLMTAPAAATAFVASAQGPAAGPSGAGTPAAPSYARPAMQRRVLPDGRVVTVVDDSQQSGEPDEPDEAAPRQDGAPGMMRPPFNAPPRAEGQTGDDAPQQYVQPGQAGGQATATSPVAPVTVGKPGALPATKPGTTSPPPIKPPGD